MLIRLRSQVDRLIPIAIGEVDPDSYREVDKVDKRVPKL